MAIVHESSATATSATCNKPTGTSTGDVLVAVVLSYSAGASLAGWTAQVSVDYSATYYTTILTRVADGSEGASFTFSSGGTVYSVGISRFSGVDTTSPINGTPTSNVGLLTPAVLPAITTTDDDAMLVMACGALPATGGITVTEVAFSAGTERWATGDASGVGSRSELATELIASAGSTGTRTITPTMSDASSYYLALAGMLALTPASGGGGGDPAPPSTTRTGLFLPL